MLIKEKLRSFVNLSSCDKMDPTNSSGFANKSIINYYLCASL